MRAFRIFLALVVLQLSFVPCYFGGNLILEGEDALRVIQGIVMIVLGGSAAAGGFHVAVLGMLLDRPEYILRFRRRAAVMFFGVALIAGGLFLFISALMILVDIEDRASTVTLFVLGLLSHELGAVLIFRAFDPSLLPVPREPEILLADPPRTPFIPPEPNLERLLEVKKRLKLAGRT